MDIDLKCIRSAMSSRMACILKELMNALIQGRAPGRHQHENKFTGRIRDLLLADLCHPRAIQNNTEVFNGSKADSWYVEVMRKRCRTKRSSQHHSVLTCKKGFHQAQMLS